MKIDSADAIETGRQDLASRPRLAIVVSHPIQHFCPMYRSIAADGRVELLVLFAERGSTPTLDKDFGKVIKWQEDILDGYAYTVVTAPEAKRCESVLGELERFSPDAIYVHGYSLPYLRESMRWAKRAGVAVLMATDSELLHPRPWYVRAVKRLLLPRILRNVDLILTVGDENERYFENYGVSRSRFHRVPFSIDSAYYDKFFSKKIEVRKAARERLGIGEDTTAILTVGKLIPRKRQADLICAFAEAIKATSRPAALVIAGDGPERATLEQLAAPLGAAVRLLGFIDVQQLPEYYLGADVYVHPSDFDPHPLVISEALYFGLPVVVTDRVGSVGPTDDVRAGVNGWVYANGDVAALSAILTKLIDDPKVRASAAGASRSLGLLHSAERCGRQFVDGALLALSRRRRVNVDG